MSRFTRVRTSSTGSGNAVADVSGRSGGSRNSSSANSNNTVVNCTNGTFGMSGLGMGFGLYRPRRPSYTLATQACRQRSESYRYATRRDNADLATDIDINDGEDFIDGVIKRTSRQTSLRENASSSCARDEEEEEVGLPIQSHVDSAHDDDDDDNVIVTTAAVAAVSRAQTPESRVAPPPPVDFSVTHQPEDSGATLAFSVPNHSYSDHLPLEPTKQVPVEANCCSRNVPNHLSLYNPYHLPSARTVPESCQTSQPGANGNGTTRTSDRTPSVCDHLNSHSPHNDLAHSIPLPPEAISRKRKTLKRSFACGESETDDLERESSAIPTVKICVTSPETTLSTTPESNSSNNCAQETVVVGLLTPVNGRVDNVNNGNKNSNSTHSRRQNSSSMHKKTKMPGMSSFSFTKNLIVLCLGFIFVYSSFRAIQNLQSSVNGGRDLGVITMTVVHISMVFASLLAPVIINIFTAKWAMCGGVMCFLAWFSAHVHPTFWTLVPTSMLVGLGQAIIWNAESSYVLKLAFDSATASGNRANLDQEMFRFHGIFLACFQSTHIWGNLISSLMLSWYKEQLLQARDSQEAMGNYGNTGVGGDQGELINAYPVGNGSYPDTYDQSSGDIELVVYCGTLHRCTPGQDQLLPDLWPGENIFFLQLSTLSKLSWTMLCCFVNIFFRIT